MEKHGTARRATDNKQYNAAHASCILDNKGCRHSEYVIRAVFTRQQWLHERPACYVTRTLPVLYSIS